VHWCGLHAVAPGGRAGSPAEGPAPGEVGRRPLPTPVTEAHCEDSYPGSDLPGRFMEHPTSRADRSPEWQRPPRPSLRPAVGPVASTAGGTAHSVGTTTVEAYAMAEAGPAALEDAGGSLARRPGRVSRDLHLRGLAFPGTQRSAAVADVPAGRWTAVHPDCGRASFSRV
jgi:hypothetical protein